MGCYNVIEFGFIQPGLWLNRVYKSKLHMVASMVAYPPNANFTTNADPHPLRDIGDTWSTL